LRYIVTALARTSACASLQFNNFREEVMHRQFVFAAAVAVAAAIGSTGAYADKSWCTDAHMQKMDAMVAKMSDAAKKRSAKTHLAASKAAMKGGDMDGCVAAMTLAHKDMGM
jgi:hypothetical protein